MREAGKAKRGWMSSQEEEGECEKEGGSERSGSGWWQVLAEDCIGEESPVRRLVTEYVRCDDGDSDAHPATGCYRKASEGTELCAYLKAKGFNVIPLSRREQLEYGCNSINLGNGRIVACNRCGPLV